MAHIHTVIIIICSFNTLLHLIGMYLLICVRHSAMNGDQRLFLLHLSLSEFCLTFLETEFCLTFLEMVRRIIYNIINSENSAITEYINIIKCSSAAMVFYSIMIYLTVDRFLHLYFGFKYTLYWYERKTKRLLIVTWILFVLLTIVLTLLNRNQLIDYRKLFYIYIWPITEVVFLVVAFGTYGYAVILVHRSSSDKCSLRCSIHSTFKWQYIFKKPAFYLPTVLILIFVLFQVVPDLIVFFVLISGNVLSQYLVNGACITYMVSISLDTVLYILLSPYVKTMLFQKLTNINAMLPRRNSSAYPIKSDV